MNIYIRVWWLLKVKKKTLILSILGHGPSPFSEEPNMVRHSPKAEVTEPKLPQGIDMGLRFGHNEEVWHEKSQKGVPPADHNPASGPGPYFPGPLQVYWYFSYMYMFR